MFQYPGYSKVEVQLKQHLEWMEKKIQIWFFILGVQLMKMRLKGH